MTDSPYVMKMFQTFQDAFFVYFALELATGGDLRQRIKSIEKKDLAAQILRVAPFYTACVIFALEHLHHRRICYRDLKPENIILNSKGYGILCDMGLAKFTFGRTFSFVGTPDYMAPEVIAQTGHNVPVDWYAFGVLCYAVVKGKTPAEAHEVQHYTQAFALAKKGFKGWALTDNPRLQPLAVPIMQPCLANEFWADTLAVSEVCCKVSPSARLPMKTDGLDQMKKMAFFKTVEWDSVSAQSIRAPLEPMPFDKEALSQEKAQAKLNDGFKTFDQAARSEVPVLEPGETDPFLGF